MADHAYIPCHMCNGTGLGNYPNECYNCDGTGVAKQYDSTQIKLWFDALKGELEKRDLEIFELKEEAGHMRKVIAALVVSSKDDFTKEKLRDRIDDLQHAYNRSSSEEATRGDRDLYDLIIGDQIANIRFSGSKLMIEEEIAKDIIE